MKKFLSLLILLVFIMSVVLTGCGPKKASDKTLTELNELQKAADEAEMSAKECQQSVEDYKAKIEELEKEIETLKQEIQKYE